MSSGTVRIKSAAHAKLKVLAGELGKSMPDVLDAAIDSLYRQRFLEDCNRAYARLKADSKAWQEAIAERRAWDATLADGLEEEIHATRPRRNVVRRARSRTRT